MNPVTLGQVLESLALTLYPCDLITSIEVLSVSQCVFSGSGPSCIAIRWVMNYHDLDGNPGTRELDSLYPEKWS